MKKMTRWISNSKTCSKFLDHEDDDLTIYSFIEDVCQEEAFYIMIIYEAVDSHEHRLT